METVRLAKEELGAFFLSLVSLIRAGVDAGDALSLMAGDGADAWGQIPLADMARRADEGEKLSRLLRDSGCVPGYACALVEAGEQVGRLEQSLDALAGHYQARAAMERRLRDELMYPCVLLAVMLAVTVVLLVWVMPVFEDVYAQLGIRLTGVAGAMVTLGKWLRRALPLLGAVLAAAAAAAALPGLRRRGADRLRRLWQDRGTGARVTAARMIQGLSLGVSSGLTDSRAAALALVLTPEDSRLRQRLEDCLEGLEKGASLPGVLGQAGLLSGARCRLLEAGIRSGRKAEMLEHIARGLLEDSEQALERTVSRVEPALVMLTSALIGVILLSVMLPLMHLLSGMG